MELYQLRAIEERDVLEDKVAALYSFINTRYFDLDDLSDEERALLEAQYYAMKTYLHILTRRIALF